MATLLDSLSLRDRVAQLIMPWVPGSYTADDTPEFKRELHWVDSLHVGGIIVSVGSPTDIAARLNALQRAAPLPLLIGSDFESGTAIRLDGGTRFPPNMGVAAGGRDSDARLIGRITAEEGRAVGVHMAFAPAADVNNNPANPIINTRSFSEDPAMAARFTAAAVRGLEENGMLATIKHFPGHGDTETDSHLALPVIDADWARLDSLELVPFRAGIDAGASAVMSAHIALPQLDQGRTRPATVVPEVLTGILRDSLGFEGLTVTDALNMQGVVSLYGAGEASVLALLAGADLLLMPADAGEAIDAIVAAVEEGRVTEERVNQSVRKLLDIKRGLGLFQHRLVPLDSVMDHVGRQENVLAAEAIAARSIVLAADDGTADSLRAAPRDIALVQYGEGTTSTVGSAFAAELRAGGHRVTALRLHAESGPASYDSVRAELDRHPYALFAVAVRPVAWKGSIGLPAALVTLIDSSAMARPSMLVSFGSPYIYAATPSMQSYLVGWAANPVSERAAARALTGAAIGGRLPTSIPPRLPFGAGLMRDSIGGDQ
ncbi:MAG TPA: glycoside hydrolase family 3 N-terminal domain-containing protein [Gemmatimonadales bacterium]|nr:glycoside hydrolase family 3 N-terminal domain-containing protein [Gemmatimonadales bacterium]